MINITVPKSFQTLTTKSLTLIQLKTIHRKETSLSLRNSTVNLEVGTSLRLTLFSPSEVTNHANLTEIGWPTLLPDTHPLSNNQMCFNRNTHPALFTTSVMGPDSSVPDLLFYSSPENKSARSGSTQVTRWCSVQRPFNANTTRDPSADGSGDIWQRRSADTVRLPLSWYRITADSFSVFAICVISWLKELLFQWLCKWISCSVI